LPDLNTRGRIQERGVTTLQNSKGTDRGMRDRLYTQKRAVEGGREVQGPIPANSRPRRSEALQIRNMNGTKRSPAAHTQDFSDPVIAFRISGPHFVQRWW
jgi:hypothetical protein